MADRVKPDDIKALWERCKAIIDRARELRRLYTMAERGEFDG